MQHLMAVWQVLDTRRRMIVAGATLAMFAAVLALSSIASKPSLSLLYAGLEGARAGDIVAALEQRGAAFEVRGSSIYVDSAQRDELRMTLAAEGLPANVSAGYELLDSLSGFSTTSQMFDAAYWRAKEGELARTIVASPHVRSARVHISNVAGQSFRGNSRATASVTVTSVGGGLSPAHAKALKYLIASAVNGMTPEDVSVIDGEGGLILAGDETEKVAGLDDRAAELKRNVERLLEARVGYGNAVVEVSIDTVTEQEAITERRFDPEGRVAISTETEERSNTAKDAGNGAVTVASNLPQGDGAAGVDSSSQTSETRERVNFEVSETTREILRSPGDVRRLTVAVLIDGTEVVDGNGGTQIEPRAQDELEALRELVASAVGFDEARGDVITLKSMAFEPIAPLGSGAAPSLLQSLAIDVMRMVQLAVLASVSLILGLFVLRPILMKAPPNRPAELTGPPSGFDDPVAPRALTGEIDDRTFPEAGMALVSGGDMDDFLPIATAELDPVARLRSLIEARQAESVEILRGWMEDSQEEKA